MVVERAPPNSSRTARNLRSEELVSTTAFPMHIDNADKIKVRVNTEAPDVTEVAF